MAKPVFRKGTRSSGKYMCVAASLARAKRDFHIDNMETCFCGKGLAWTGNPSSPAKTPQKSSQSAQEG